MSSLDGLPRSPRAQPTWVVLAVLGLQACNTSEAQIPSSATPPGQTLALKETGPRITSLESDVIVEAQFNPKELSVDKSVPWQKHKNSEEDSPTLEFTGAEPKTMQVELLFDMFEQGNVHKTYIQNIEKLAQIDADKKRPPLCTFTWGSMPVFKGVVESLNVKYTLFLPDGTPCRATVNLKMKEASKLLNKKEASAASNSCSGDSDCQSGEVCQRGACVR